MKSSSACSTTVGVFETHDAAERAVADLRAAGYRDEEIGVVVRDQRGDAVRADEAHAGEGAAAGAGALGMSFVVIPVIGPVLAVGPLAAALLSAAGDAAAGGVAGALVGWGIPDEDARYCESEVNAGRYVVTADRGDRTEDPWEIFARHGGRDRASAPRA